MKLTKAARWIADSFNEYAAWEDAGKQVPGHTPGSPMFWFYGLARECGEAFLAHPDLRALLTASAIEKLERDQPVLPVPHP